jgi:hypothetical protein
MAQLPKPHFEWEPKERRLSVVGIAGLLAIESLRLLIIEVRARKGDPSGFLELPRITPMSEEGWVVKRDPKTGVWLGVTLGQDLFTGGLSGCIDVNFKGRFRRQQFLVPYWLNPSSPNLDRLGKEQLLPAVRDLLDAIVPVPKDLPNLMADFSYQSC